MQSAWLNVLPTAQFQKGGALAGMSKGDKSPLGSVIMVNFPKSYYVFGQLDFTWIPANAPPPYIGTALLFQRKMDETRAAEEARREDAAKSERRALRDAQRAYQDKLREMEARLGRWGWGWGGAGNYIHINPVNYPHQSGQLSVQLSTSTSFGH